MSTSKTKLDYQQASDLLTKLRNYACTEYGVAADASSWALPGTLVSWCVTRHGSRSYHRVTYYTVSLYDSNKRFRKLNASTFDALKKRTDKYAQLAKGDVADANDAQLAAAQIAFMASWWMVERGIKMTHSSDTRRLVYAIPEWTDANGYRCKAPALKVNAVDSSDGAPLFDLHLFGSKRNVRIDQGLVILQNLT